MGATFASFVSRRGPTLRLWLSLWGTFSAVATAVAVVLISCVVFSGRNGPAWPSDGVGVLDAVAFYAGFILKALVFFGGIGVVAGGALAFSIGGRVAALRRAADGYLRGEFGPKRFRTGRDEIGQLAAAIERLGAALPVLLEDRMLKGAWEERGRLARELHDTVKQDLFAISLNLESLESSFPDTDSRKSALAELHRAISGLSRTVGAMVATFREARDVDFAAVVEAEFGKWKAAAAIARTSLAMEAVAEEPALRATLALIAREAIANAAKHACPDGVDVVLRRASGDLVLSVRDDGVGLGPAWEEGFGAKMIRERARAAGGVARWISPPATGGRGTELMISIPIDWPEPRA